MKVRAIILAAGKGTRMKSAQTKVLHELCGRPMLWYTIAALRAAGVDEMLVVSNDQLQSRLPDFGVQGVIQEKQLGTGHAVQVALKELAQADGRVIIAYGDMPLVGSNVFSAVLDRLDRERDASVAMVTARMPLPSSFGRVLRTGDDVARIVEERDCTPEQKAIDEMNAGIYAFDEQALRKSIAELRNDNAQNEYYLTDTIESLVNAGNRVVPVLASDHHDVLGVNDRSELARARREMNARLCDQYMAQGVTIIDPMTTYLEPELIFGRDTVVYPNCTISRLTEVGEACVIGPNSRLSNAKVGARSTVRESVILDSVLGEDTTVGPFAHIRANGNLGARVHIGNFVEVKNSTLSSGVKTSHLSYLGDATVGENTNVGAGTITCNYDGVRKNRTQIGRDAFIGSNTSLVAPINIGDGALTGAGSVVTKDVPGGERVAGNPARPLPKKS
ncbi:MAG: bifunctional UDP-N-acetylglucosamine diphosphorylase/glucosamine-1-phosphate N-acetyltransferase GlmU [Candidatus Eremiobacteraeota bacterium]|nr:bifunctional UDP-N-acetylglucosamine diphosphorylase/glucosamine-1-phosphate N-acetyltransferase GlmU [Candidatus Eremiobacteraeota bacterium]